LGFIDRGRLMPKAKYNSIDRSIGDRIKAHRKDARISQTALGKHLGVSFQQVQKYENGTNKLSAASVLKIARFLNVPASELMAPDGQPATSAQKMMQFAKSSEGKTLLQGFMAISDWRIRRHILGLLRTAIR
jgi:transcriptional regulator with XRE-family HTH domain